MKTTFTHINRRILVTALAVSILVLAAMAAPTAGTTARVTRPSGGAQPVATTRLAVVHRLSTARRVWTYDWPVKPFRVQHPVRGYLGDPRIKGASETFHFGIDVSAPDGTLVYAIESGVVHAQNTEAIAIVTRDGAHTFGYWHIIPFVRPGAFVRRHQVIGKIAAGWEHVHLAERVGRVYVNPLRQGGIGPYRDPTAPTVDAVALSGSTLTVTVRDTPYPAVPGAWGGKFVTPALIRWRIVGTTYVPAWQTAADFREVLPAPDLFRRVYGAATLQNHKFSRGLYAIILTRSWREPTHGSWTLQVEVSDTMGNRSTASIPVRQTRV